MTDIKERLEVLAVAALKAQEQPLAEDLAEVAAEAVWYFKSKIEKHQDALMKTLLGFKWEWSKWEVNEKHPAFLHLADRARGLLDEVFPQDLLEKMMRSELKKPAALKSMQKAVSDAVAYHLEMKVAETARRLVDSMVAEAIEQILHEGVEKCLPTTKQMRDR